MTKKSLAFNQNMADESILYGDQGRSTSPTTSLKSSTSQQALVAPDNDREAVVTEGGLSVTKTGIFAIAQMAGTGMLALPCAFMKTGWGGIGVVLFVFLMALYCGIMLGKCWEIVRRDNAIEGHVRDPYPLIGEYAMGKFGKYLVGVCVVLTLFGAVIVYLIIAATLTKNLLNQIPSVKNQDFNQEKIWVLIFGGVLIPLTWFESPKDMSFVGYIGGGSSVLACILIIMRLLSKYITDGHAKFCGDIPAAASSFLEPFGDIAFAYGGAMIFPTLQSDMKQPGKFTYSAIIGFVGISILYLPMFILPYIVLGEVTESNILIQLSKLKGTEEKILIQAAEILMVFHLLFVTLLSINPVSQQIEEIFRIPQSKSLSHQAWI